jgi:hypothetical protein
VSFLAPVKTLVQEEPAATLTVLTWAAGVICGVIGYPDYAGVLVTMGAAVLGLRTQVIPKTRAKTAVVSGATDAATTVASQLTDGTAGPVGEVTTAGQKVVDDAVGLVAGLIGGKKK